MQLNYQETGEGKPMVILHGLFGSLDNWRTLARVFSDHFRVISVDQRNHGKSPHSDEMNYPAMADDLAELVDHLGLNEIVLVGHSMGGKTAMQFAVQYPALLADLIVVDMSPQAYPPQHKDIIAALERVPINTVSSREQVDEHLAESIPQPAIRQFLMKGLKRLPGNRFAWKFNLDVLSAKYDNILVAIEPEQRVQVPALFLGGERSPYLKQVSVQELRQLFPQAELDFVPRAGHWVHAEAPKAFAEKIGERLGVHFSFPG